MSALAIRGLSKSFGDVPVLHELELEVEQGSLVAILGASGGGKTTLLRLICGFERQDAGTISIGGQLASGPDLHRRPEQRHIGYVAQDGALFPHLSVGRNILFGLDRNARREHRRAEALLELVGLPISYAARPPQELSGGEQQRVALARALAPAPSLVLLDEPFSALDAALRAGTRRAVADALSRAGATALLVTHDQSEALSMGDRVGVLRHGRLVQIAAPSELYCHPVDAELARFVGEAVLMEGYVTGRSVACALGRLVLASATPDGPVMVMVRPEQIVVGPLSGSGCDARIASVSYYGHDASLGLVLPMLETPLLARVGGAQALSFRDGDAVRLSVEGTVVAFPRTPGQ